MKQDKEDSVKDEQPKNPPEVIYLQVEGSDGFDEFKDLGGVTWCSDKINENDIPYVLQSQLAAQSEQIRQLQESNEFLEKCRKRWAEASIKLKHRVEELKSLLSSEKEKHLSEAWVSCDERLPGINQVILAYTGVVVMARYVAKKVSWGLGEVEYQFERYTDSCEGDRIMMFHYTNVTYWKELTFPPDKSTYLSSLTQTDVKTEK